jgi:hypothetical protein
MKNAERAVYVLVIALSIGVLAALLPSALEEARSPVAVKEGKLTGTRLDVPGILWQSSQVNAVLFISASCPFCLANAAFYRRISDPAARNSGVPIRVITLDPVGEMNGFLAREHIRADGVYHLFKPIPGLVATPTLMIVDGNGMIKKVFRGALKEKLQSRFLAT